MIITREKGMRMWGGGSGSTSASGVNGGGGFSLAVTEGEGTGNAYTDFTYESGTLTLNKGSEFVTVDFFNKLFTAYDANGNVIAPNNTTPTLDNIKFKAGAWTEQYLSALGQNSSGGGGGGGIELSDVWQSLKTNTDDYANQKINSAHIPDLSGTYATKTWVNQQGFVTSSGVTSVAMTVPTGLSVSGTPITSTGTLALTFATGYSIPTTAKQSNWDTAYGWGNHANAGYALASDVYSSSASRTKNYVLAAPSTANGAATFRKLVASDIPDLSSTYATASRATTLEGYFNTGGVAKVAAKLNTGTTTYSAWGQTYWSSGVPQSISGNMTSVGSITPSANGNALGTSSARFNIYGTSGNFSGNVSITGTLGVTGATTLSSSLSVASGITLTTTKKIYFGDTSHYIELTSTGFHFSHGIYSDSFVSALGANSSGGGGGGADLGDVWDSLTNQTGTTPTSTTKIAVAHIPDISSTYGYAKTSQLGNYLPLSGGTMSNTNLVTNLNADLLDGQHASYFAAASSLSNYVTLTTAQTISGDKTFTGSIIMGSNHSIFGANESGGAMSYFDGSRTVIGSVGATSTKATHLRSITGHLTVGNSNAASYNVLDSGNYTDYTVTKTGSGASGTWGISISGTAAQANQVYDYQSGDGAFFASCQRGIGSTNTGALVLAYGSNPIRFYTNNTEKMRIAADGNVGIGTDSPSYKLDVVGSIRASGSVYVGTNDAYVGSTSTTNIFLQNSSGSVLVCDSKVVRRGIALSDVTLGSSSYPWLAAYATTFYGALNGNASTATTLATPRTIWGQSFDGSSDVSGSITGATTITASGRISASAFEGDFVTDGTVFYFGDSQHAIGSGTDAVLWAYGANSILFYTNNSRRMTINSGGSVGIGTSSPSQKLHVTGNILASGEVTASSDERKKNIISNTKFNVKDIASARSIIYEWNDGRDKDNSKKIHGGSIAQDWLGKADSFLSQDNDGWYSINYGALALCSAITIAKEVVKHEDRITLLEKENARLKARVAELEERRA